MSNVFICILINWLLRRYLILWVEILCMYTCHSRPVGERSLGWESDRDVISGKSFPAFLVSTCFRNWKRENPTVALIILICAEKVKVNLNIISIIYVSRSPNKRKWNKIKKKCQISPVDISEIDQWNYLFNPS